MLFRRTEPGKCLWAGLLRETLFEDLDRSFSVFVVPLENFLESDLRYSDNECEAESLKRLDTYRIKRSGCCAETLSILFADTPLHSGGGVIGAVYEQSLEGLNISSRLHLGGKK